jgi:hypothetical protein
MKIFYLTAYILFNSLLFTHTAVVAEELEINSEVYSITPETDYFIIKVGFEQGLEIGDGLIVHRNGEKIAEAKIIEVRTAVSAAEILNIVPGQELKVGDNIILVKQLGKAKKIAEAEEQPVAKRSKWTPILGSTADRTKQPYPVSTMYSNAITTEQEETVLTVGIQSPLNIIFPYTLAILRENGYSVTYTNRLTGTILAAKPIELPIISELWADSISAIDHKLVVSLKIKENSNVSELNITSFKEHFQKGKHIKIPIGIDSKYYLEIDQIASKIKEKAESH